MMYGRPAPDMIKLAMQKFNISDSKSVINLGDTPSDLQSAHHANVLYSVGSLYGTHKENELMAYPHDLFIKEPKAYIDIIKQL